MRSSVLMLLAGLLVAAGMLWPATPSAEAVKSFKAQFETKYVKPAKDDGEDVLRRKATLAKLVANVKCDVCHQGKNKKARNAYGDALAKLLDKKADKNNIEKILKALDEVAKRPCDPENEKSPTFGTLIGQGKLPVAPPAEKESRE